MSRYIDAELLIADIQRYLCASCSIHCSPLKTKNSACDIAECIRMIGEAPTADVELVRYGQWTHKSEDYSCRFECSACKTEENDIPTLMGKPLFDYCPYCAAKMYGDGQK